MKLHQHAALHHHRATLCHHIAPRCATTSRPAVPPHRATLCHHAVPRCAATSRPTGPHYAITLREWRQRWEDAHADVLRLGYSERFWRKFRYACALQAGRVHSSCVVPGAGVRACAGQHPADGRGQVARLSGVRANTCDLGQADPLGSLGTPGQPFNSCAPKPLILVDSTTEHAHSSCEPKPLILVDYTTEHAHTSCARADSSACVYSLVPHALVTQHVFLVLRTMSGHRMPASTHTHTHTHTLHHNLHGATSAPCAFKAVGPECQQVSTPCAKKGGGRPQMVPPTPTFAPPRLASTHVNFIPGPPAGHVHLPCAQHRPALPCAASTAFAPPGI